MDYGDDASGPLRVRLEIERAPGTTVTLFTEEIMTGLSLSTDYIQDDEWVPIDELVTFTQVDGPDRYHAYFPLPQSPDGRRGLIYLYRGELKDGDEIAVRGAPHLGIVYELTLEDGLIAQGSQLWMDAIFFSNRVIPPSDGERVVPWREWFGYEPIPVIEGENTDDPVLLGIPEHVDSEEALD